jgi:signal peptidase II
LTDEPAELSAANNSAADTTEEPKVSGPNPLPRLAILVVLGVLMVDQALKLWVAGNMLLGDEIVIAPWFRLHYTENNGMAFGLEWGGDGGKLALSLFRLAAVSFMAYYLVTLVKKGVEHTSKWAVVCWSLILAGASGNILDSIIYGPLFQGQPVLFGRVVDMLYFPIYAGYLPEWLGGNYFRFFEPIFNLADASISCGVFTMLIFYKQVFGEGESVKKAEPTED